MKRLPVCLQIGSLFLFTPVAFYLILDVAVGGTNGWFPDGPEKPWLDGSTSQYFLFVRVLGFNVYCFVTSLAPALDFWRQKDQWLPTWPTDAEGRSMVV